MRISTLGLLVTALVLSMPEPARCGAPRVRPRAGLSGGARSTDVLVQRLLNAIQAGDLAALDRLRVTRTEYLDVILPGSVAPGEPPQRMPHETALYFWELLDTKSRYGARQLLADFGGRRYRVTRVAFAKGRRRYAGYEALEQLRLDLVDEHGDSRELATGSIAVVGGVHKFVSFVRD